MTTSNEIKTKQTYDYKVRRDNLHDIAFRGELLAKAEGMETGSEADFIYKIYKTASGNYVCAKECYHIISVCEAIVCDNEDEIIEFFEQGNLAHELYDAAFIDNFELIT